MLLLILCSIKIERLLLLKILKNLAFFDSYFWPFNKSEEKIKVIFVISAIHLKCFYQIPLTWWKTYDSPTGKGAIYYISLHVLYEYFLEYMAPLTVEYWTIATFDILCKDFYIFTMYNIPTWTIGLLDYCSIGCSLSILLHMY